MSDTTITAERLLALGFTEGHARRCIDGTEPTHNSWDNESVPVFELRGKWVWLACWADLSRWWIVALQSPGYPDGHGIETYIPGPAAIDDVAALVRLLGVTTPEAGEPPQRKRIER